MNTRNVFIFTVYQTYVLKLPKCSTVCTSFDNYDIKKAITFFVDAKISIDIGRCGMSANETALHLSNNL